MEKLCSTVSYRENWDFDASMEAAVLGLKAGFDAGMSSASERVSALISIDLDQRRAGLVVMQAKLKHYQGKVVSFAGRKLVQMALPISSLICGIHFALDFGPFKKHERPT